jgi:hypothetical protein
LYFRFFKSFVFSTYNKNDDVKNENYKNKEYRE